MNDETGAPRSELGGNVGDDLAPKSVRLELWIIDFRKAGADSHCIGLNALDAGHGYQRINAFFQGREKRDDFAKRVTAHPSGLLDLFDLLRSRMVKIYLRRRRP